MGSGVWRARLIKFRFGARVAENQNAGIKITVDGAEFDSFVRALKRFHRASDIGEVVSVCDNKLTIETACGGSVLPYNEAPPVVARVHGGNFLRLVHLATDAKVTGPLVIVFHPEFGEIVLPYGFTRWRWQPTFPASCFPASTQTAFAAASSQALARRQTRRFGSAQSAVQTTFPCKPYPRSL